VDERVAHEHALAEEPSLEGDAVDSFTGGQGGGGGCCCCCFEGEDESARVSGAAVAEHAAEEGERAGREAGAEEAAHHGGEHVGVGALGALGEDGGGVGGARRVGERAEGEEAGGREAVRGEAGDGEQRLELEEAQRSRRESSGWVTTRLRFVFHAGRGGGAVAAGAGKGRGGILANAKPPRARAPGFDWACDHLPP